jgi:hypothetical protein
MKQREILPGVFFDPTFAFFLPLQHLSKHGPYKKCDNRGLCPEGIAGITYTPSRQ